MFGLDDKDATLFETLCVESTDDLDNFGGESKISGEWHIENASVSEIRKPPE